MAIAKWRECFRSFVQWFWEIVAASEGESYIPIAAPAPSPALQVEDEEPMMDLGSIDADRVRRMLDEE